MNILILGSGDAEYSLAKRASASSLVYKIFVAPGNDLTNALSGCENVSITVEQTADIECFIKKESIQLCITDAKNCQELFSTSTQDTTELTTTVGPLNYQQSGVDIEEGNRFVQLIKPLIQTTVRKEAITKNFGGFCGAFRIPEHYKKPLLISATDGVGTKLKYAVEFDSHENIGIDLVAMCVNDLIVCGAEPLFFLDYLATSKLVSEQAEQIVDGICKGCRIAGCTLIGGETAEMPGIYQANDYDLAGFGVGVVEEEEMIDGSLIQPGDSIIGLSSSGLHSNGYSLVRSIIQKEQSNFNELIGDKTLKQWLLTPTQIYAKDILCLKQTLKIKGIAHITGGGIVENLPRTLPSKVTAEIKQNSWHVTEIFSWLQQQGNISEQEMWRVFNMGIGMIIIISNEDQASALKSLHHLNPAVIGSIIPRTDDAVVLT